jgi:hypothetical protein
VVEIRGARLEIFREIFIRGSTEQLAATIAEMVRSLPDGWSQDLLAERRLGAIGSKTKATFCFALVSDDRLPAATIFITQEEPGTLVASNIIPRDKDRLSLAEYNSLLEEFYERIVRPCADRAGAIPKLTDKEANLSHWLSETAAKKLRTFSMGANKGTGSSHPIDRERWIDFILTAHREGNRLDASTLRRWLIEIEGWAPEVADQLAGEYEFGGEILTFSDDHRGVA